LLLFFRFATSLRLEWNQIGAMHSPAFSIFCDALADNRTLVDLDLRNNDINHVAASELVSALKRNTCLRALGRQEKKRLTEHRLHVCLHICIICFFLLLNKLDLRWNNVGLIGGRAFLALFQTNNILHDLQLLGNNIPDDIMESIGKFFLVQFFYSSYVRCLVKQMP
jgi:hypothetical protein